MVFFNNEKENSITTIDFIKKLLRSLKLPYERLVSAGNVYVRKSAFDCILLRICRERIS